jgi:hypothetical protein
VLPRRTRKAQLLANSLSLHSEYIIAEKLGMTHARLLRELGPGEMAYWLAFLEIEHDQYQQMRKDTERKAE